MRVLLFFFGLLIVTIVSIIWHALSIKDEDFGEWFMHRKPNDIICSILLWITTGGWWIIVTMIHYTHIVRKKRRKEKQAETRQTLNEEAIESIRNLASVAGCSVAELRDAINSACDQFERRNNK